MAPLSLRALLSLLPAAALASSIFHPPRDVKKLRRAPQAGSPTADAPPPVSTVCGDIFDDIRSEEKFDLFYAKPVYECLLSVPFHPAVALRFIEYYNTTLQFHSTLAYLRDPPPGYQQPAVDVLDRLARIKARVEAGGYGNQYAFEADLQRLVHDMHDSHVELDAGALSPFSFTAPFAISAASVDGQQPPKVYFTNDIIEAQRSGWAWEPSPIAAFNGRPAAEFLVEFAAENAVGLLEPHADWNQLMWHPAQYVVDEWNTFTGGIPLYPGDDVNGDDLRIRLEDGTEESWQWLAVYEYLYDTGPLTTGGDFFNYFVLGLAPASRQPDTEVGESIHTSERSPSWADETLGAYPEHPDIAQPNLSLLEDGDITGYFLRDISTGVLSLPTFQQYGAAVEGFTGTVQRFIDEAKNAGLTRIVIDLHQNQGGMVSLALDTYGRFFPNVRAYDGSRRRSHHLGNVLGNTMTAWWEQLDNATDPFDFMHFMDDEWVITPRLNAETGANFASWDEYAGQPRTFRGDAFSLTERYNLSDVDFDMAAFHHVPAGHGSTGGDGAQPEQPWAAENIVILTDGLCSSTCAMFVEFMTRRGVRTVVAGGQPTPGPMQAASGSRGARMYSADHLDALFAHAGEISRLANASLPNIPVDHDVRDQGMWTTFAGFTLRDQLREEDAGAGEEPIPLQFRYEAADCRIYYTLRNIWNMTQLWRDAAAAAWDDPTLCVEGSTGFSTTAGQPRTNGSPPNLPPVPPAAPARPPTSSSSSANAAAAGTVYDIASDESTIMGGRKENIRSFVVVDSCATGCHDLACRSNVTLGASCSGVSMCVPKVSSQDDCVNRHDAKKFGLETLGLRASDSKGNGDAKFRDVTVKKKLQFVCVPTREADDLRCPNR